MHNTTDSPELVRHSFSLISHHKMVSLAVAGALATAGVAASANIQAHSGDSPDASVNITANDGVGQQQATADTQSTTSTPGDQSTTTPTGGADVYVQVNGRNITVPTNGSTRQTVPSPTGQAHVTINRNQGTAANNNTSSLTINVSSDSSTNGNGSTSSTVITQNGGTTSISD